MVHSYSCIVGNVYVFWKRGLNDKFYIDPSYTIYVYMYVCHCVFIVLKYSTDCLQDVAHVSQCHSEIQILTT